MKRYDVEVRKGDYSTTYTIQAPSPDLAVSKVLDGMAPEGAEVISIRHVTFE